MLPTLTPSRLGAGSLISVLLSVASTSCAGGPEAPSALVPVSAAPYAATSPDAGAAPAVRAGQLHAVAHVVRHWFGRYRERYSELVRIEDLVPHVDSPTHADVFVVATFTNAGPLDPHGHPILQRPKAGRYYRSVQLQLRHGRWHIESVQPA